MSNEKRYYWLKFREDFFGSMRIKKLRKMAGGDTYVIIYLKMQLKALKTGGILQYKGVEKDFPSELALDIDEDEDDVRMVLSFLLAYDMCECSDNIHYYLPFVAENTGSETASTQRVREFREREKQKALHCNADETEVKRICNAEIEIEKDIDIIPPCIPPLQGETPEKKTKKRNSKPFKAPTLDEVKAYVTSENLKVDAETFYKYFTTPDEDGRTWFDSEGKPVKNWKQKLRTWSSLGGPKGKKRNTLDNYEETGISHPKTESIAYDMEEL